MQRDPSLISRSRGACSRRVEDIIGKGSAFGRKEAVYVTDGALAVRSFADSLVAVLLRY
jgi:hypothetical protein